MGDEVELDKLDVDDLHMFQTIYACRDEPELFFKLLEVRDPNLADILACGNNRLRKTENSRRVKPKKIKYLLNRKLSEGNLFHSQLLCQDEEEPKSRAKANTMSQNSTFYKKGCKNRKNKSLNKRVRKSIWTLCCVVGCHKSQRTEGKLGQKFHSFPPT